MSATEALLRAAALVRIVSRDAGTGQLERSMREILGASSRDDPQEEPGFRPALRALSDEVDSLRTARELRYADLLDVIADIATQEDTPTVLSHIADRARRTVGDDVAYLWLASDSGATASLGAAAGAMTADLVDLTVPVGRAMAGRIIATAMPMVVEDYFASDDFAHSEEIDVVMRRERIVSAAGVPMVRGTTALGALICASRDAREYTTLDVALLRTLASHAAIAVDHSRRLTHASDAVEALGALRRHVADVERDVARTEAAHAALSRVALQGGDFDALAGAMMDVLGGQIAVFDPGGRLLGGASDRPSQLEQDLIERASASHEAQIADHTAVIPIMAASRFLGTLRLRRDALLTEVDVYSAERAAITAALLLLKDEADAGAASFNRDDFLDDLIFGAENRARLIRRGAQLRMELRRPYTVHVVAADASRRHLARVAHEEAHGLGGIAGQPHAGPRGHRAPVVALLPGSDPGANTQRLAHGLARTLGTAPTVAGAGPATDIDATRALFEEASTCLAALRRIHGRSGAAATMRDLGFLGVVLGGTPDAARFVRRALGAVVEYDSHHQTDLLTTLDTLLTTDGGPTAAAQRLHVHVNTVKQRIQRLNALLGDDWRTPERQAELHIAMRLYRMRDWLGPTE